MLSIFHKKRKPEHVRKTVGHEKEFVWEKRDLPSAGANSYAFLSQGLPLYTYWGNGIRVTNPLRETTPASYAKQTAAIIGNPYSGYFQGQFVTQPLMNPNNATALGIVQPGQLPPGAYNTLPTNAPVLAP